MGPAPVRGTVDRHLSPARATVLEWLQQQAGAVTVEQTATALALHPNTAREHLAALAGAGLAQVSQASPQGRGRPASQYLAAVNRQEPDRRVRDYAALASALCAHIASTSEDPFGDARRAGERWGQALAAEVTARRRPEGSHAARRAVVEELADLGYEPHADARAASVALRRCPLLDVARDYPDVVCAAHLGMVRSMLGALGGDPERVTLKPFAEPGACRLHLLAPAAQP